MFTNQNKEKEKHQNSDDDKSSTSDDEEIHGQKLSKSQQIEKEKKKLKRLKKKPDQLRRELFEVILRKRIFLTDRMEKVEKILVQYGIVSEKQMANQQSELSDKESYDYFIAVLGQMLEKQTPPKVAFQSDIDK